MARWKTGWEWGLGNWVLAAQLPQRACLHSKQFWFPCSSSRLKDVYIIDQNVVSRNVMMPNKFGARLLVVRIVSDVWLLDEVAKEAVECRTLRSMLVLVLKYSEADVVIQAAVKAHAISHTGENDSL